LRDGREVWVRGQRIDDVTEHPALKVGVETACIDYAVSEDPSCQSFAVVSDGTDVYSRYFLAPRSVEDLLLRRRLIEECSRRAYGVVPLAKDAGSDGLNALSVVAPKIDRDKGTEYASRVEAFRRYLQQRDLSVALAMTDPKGDRTRRPWQQVRPDYYLRVMEKRAGGIVVRGAKFHISTAPYTNELLVLPTRAMSVSDREFAVAFAIPVNTPGIVVVARASHGTQDHPDEHPVSSRYALIEGTVVFRDVLVPEDRVFLCGEWEWAGRLTEMFANFHRFTAAAYKYPALCLLAGTAAWIAICNGTDRVPHIRDKIVGLLAYAETVRALSMAAAVDARIDADTGIHIPSPLTGNLAKLYFAEGFHSAVRALQDIAGGLTVTAPHTLDWEHPYLHELLEPFLGGPNGITAEERFRAFKLVRDLVASDFGGFWEVATIHAEGSIAAERLAIEREINLGELVSYARSIGLRVP
jgi:4-hydroxybutyryl-CoA dehydratase/vinylacetyl-CoA-Delta-isomerase